MKGIRVEGEFEVFDSSGGWTFLFGKPLLRRFRAMHNNHNVDTVSIQSDQGTAILCSGNAQAVVTAPTGNRPTSNVEQQETSVGGSSSMNPPSRQVLHITGLETLVRNDKFGFIADDTTIAETKAGERLKGEEWCEDEQGDGQDTNQGGSNEPPSREVLNHSPAPDEAKESDQPHSPVLEYRIEIQKTNQPTESAQACQTEIPLIKQDDHSGGSTNPHH